MFNIETNPVIIVSFDCVVRYCTPRSYIAQHSPAYCHLLGVPVCIVMYCLCSFPISHGSLRLLLTSVYNMSVLSSICYCLHHLSLKTIPADSE